MSYPVELDETSDAKLYEEILRRQKSRENGLCPYCGGSMYGIPCRFKDIHTPDYIPVLTFLETSK